MEYIVILGAAAVAFALIYSVKIEDHKDPSELTHEYDGCYSAINGQILLTTPTGHNPMEQPSNNRTSVICEQPVDINHFTHCSVMALMDVEYEFTRYCRNHGLVHKEPDGYIKLETYPNSALVGKWILRTEDPEFKVGCIVAKPYNRICRIRDGGSVMVELFKIVDVYEMSGTFVLEKLHQHFYVNCDGKGNYKIG